MRVKQVDSSHKQKFTTLFAVGYKKQWKHYADKNRTVASDQTRKERLLADLQEAGLKHGKKYTLKKCKLLIK